LNFLGAAELGRKTRNNAWNVLNKPKRRGQGRMKCHNAKEKQITPNLKPSRYMLLTKEICQSNKRKAFSFVQHRINCVFVMI
jgi:hypothetical protein